MLHVLPMINNQAMQEEDKIVLSDNEEKEKEKEGEILLLI